MTTLVPSLSMQPCGLYGGATGSPKLLSSIHYISGSKVAHRLEKINLERRLVCGEFAQDGRSYKNQNMELHANSRISATPTEERVSTSTEVGELEDVSSYSFRTEIGGQVKVLVGKRNTKYAVYIEVLNLQLSSSNKKFVLSWGTSRMPMEFQSSVLDARTRMTETPFVQKSFGRFALNLEFGAKETPFYISFLIKLDADSNTPEIRSHRKTNFVVPVGFASGDPTPLGPSFSTDGSINLAFFSRNAESVVLCLYDNSSTDKPALEIGLDPYVNRSGDVWHASLESARTFVSYGFRCKGAALDKFNAEHVILDPYAKVIGDSSSNNLGQLCKEPAFDWSGDIHPNLPLEKLVVYRLNVMRFTMEKSSQLHSDFAGAFSGLTQKLQHFKDLGVNAVLLEPIFPFDEKKGPYFSCHFFSPMNLLGPSGESGSAINSMKEMVKGLHANGIEVLLEVVFTHTANVGALQGIDDSSYYYLNEDSATKSDLNCNYPVVQQLIVDSLRYWVTEFHVDGFCFINASSLLRGFHGENLSRPPLIETIAFDPLLSKTKIVADCWDPHDMVAKEVSFPHWKRWAEMNTKFCTDARTFLKGDGVLSDLATLLCGSGDIFSNGRGPAFSFNFISRNAGLPLVDLVSFSSSDLASESSWNCGEEGPTSKTAVLERRLKQIRNFLFILYISLGVPVLNMGDECGQSSGGSPAYGDRKPFNWNALKTGFGIQITQFISFLSSLRIRRSDLLQKKNFPKVENIDWHAPDQSSPTWDDPTSKFLAMTLKANEVETQLSSKSSHTMGHLFIAFNADNHSERVTLPPPPSGMAWLRLVDTALPFPGFFSADGELVIEKIAGLVYEMKSYSCTLFEARTASD